MPIVAKRSEKTFTPAPAGSHQAVCVDVVDLGFIESNFKNPDGSPKRQHKVALAWQVSELMESGKRFLVWNRYTLSLDEKANLRRDLESWRGRPFTEDELNGFDLETVIGANAILNIVHKQGTKGGTFSNVASVMPLMKGMQKIASADGYVRQCERKEADQSEQPLTDDDIPF